MMNPKNILQLLQKSFDNPQYDIESVITDEERSFALHLENLIKDSINTQVFVESYNTLSNDDESVFSDVVAVEEEFENDYEEIVKDNKKVKVTVDIEYKRQAVEFWHSGKKKNKSLETVQHRFRKVKDKKLLYRWEAQIIEGGTRIEKLLQISKYVLEQFQKACDKSLPIHDLDLKRWALKARNEVNLSCHLFMASTKWVHNFKIRHRIISRKINKFVTKTQLTNKEQLVEEANEFVTRVKSNISLLGEDNVYNSDQSGFNLETHAGRTLSFKGSLKIECLAQSLNSLTHSYTIQPILSASGVLKSPLLIVLQEPGGQFGPIVQKTMYKADNIVAFASTSGKLTSDLAIKWFEDVYLPNAGERSVLCLDSWTGQTEKKFNNIDKGDKDVKIMTIPPGTTGLIQPLDVYTFRPWKNFLKQFSDLILLYGYDVNLHLRNNILKIQSLIHNQFSSPRFRNIFKYAWFKSGYITEKPDKCETPVNYCFKNCDTCCQFCNDIVAIIRCAWCTKYMCMQHFFAMNNEISPHYCTDYQK